MIELGVLFCHDIEEAFSKLLGIVDDVNGHEILFPCLYLLLSQLLCCLFLLLFDLLLLILCAFCDPLFEFYVRRIHPLILAFGQFFQSFCGRDQKVGCNQSDFG